jgi:hypothetical protein
MIPIQVPSSNTSPPQTTTTTKRSRRNPNPNYHAHRRQRRRRLKRHCGRPPMIMHPRAVSGCYRRLVRTKSRNGDSVWTKLHQRITVCRLSPPPRPQLGVPRLDHMGNMSHSHGVVWSPHVDGPAGPSSVQFLGRHNYRYPQKGSCFSATRCFAFVLYVAYCNHATLLNRRTSVHYCKSKTRLYAIT